MEMKSILKTTALSVLMMSAMTAQAVPVNTTLTVKGTITPAACVPSLANNGVIDFGETSAGRLPATGSMTLAARSLTATITCASAASVAMTFKDNRAVNPQKLTRRLGSVKWEMLTLAHMASKSTLLLVIVRQV